MFERKVKAAISAMSIMLVAGPQLVIVPAAFAKDSADAPDSFISNPRAVDSSAAETEASNPQLKAGTQSTVLQAGVQYCVPHGTPLKLKIAAVPSNGLELLDRDLEGNLLPARLGEKITARVSEDMFVDDNKVIPEGTVFYGKVSRIVEPRRANRPGSLEISFDHLERPDGKKFKLYAIADNKKESTVKTKAKGTGRVLAYAGGGAIVGAMVAYQLFGLKNTIAMHGYNIAGGAAGGALLATGYALMKKGHAAVLEPGDDLNLALDSDLLLPAAVEQTTKAPSQNLYGLDIKVKKTKIVADGLDGKLLCMDVHIDNRSHTVVRSIDLFVEDTEGNRDPIVGGPDAESQYIFRVEPNTEFNGKIFFQVHWPKLNHSLVWVNSRSRKVAYRQAVK